MKALIRPQELIVTCVLAQDTNGAVMCEDQDRAQCTKSAHFSIEHKARKLHSGNMATLHLCRQSAMRSPLRLFPPPLRILIGRSYSTTAIQLDFMAVRGKRSVSRHIEITTAISKASRGERRRDIFAYGASSPEMARRDTLKNLELPNAFQIQTRS